MWQAGTAAVAQPTSWDGVTCIGVAAAAAVTALLVRQQAGLQPCAASAAGGSRDGAALRRCCQPAGATTAGCGPALPRCWSTLLHAGRCNWQLAHAGVSVL